MNASEEQHYNPDSLLPIDNSEEWDKKFAIIMNKLDQLKKVDQELLIRQYGHPEELDLYQLNDLYLVLVKEYN